MKSMSDMIADLAQHMKEGVFCLFLQHSRWKRCQETPGVIVSDPYGDHDWADLSTEGRPNTPTVSLEISWPFPFLPCSRQHACTLHRKSPQNKPA